MNRFLATVISHLTDKPEAIFSRFIREGKSEDIHWRDLETSAAAFLGSYRAQRLPQGGLILIFLRHVPELYGSFLGAMLGGFRPSYMPCSSAKQDPRLYWTSHATLFARIQPALVVADRATLVEMQANGLDLSRTSTLAIEDVTPSRQPWAESSDSEIGLLQHSSGTTGLKKGIALSYGAIARQLDSYMAALGIGDEEVVVSWLPLYHDMGLVACFLMPLYAGIPIVHLDPFEWLARPGRLLEQIMQWRGTLVWLPNFAFEYMAAMAGRDAANYRLGCMRAFINCSEPCRPASFDRFEQAFAVSGVTANMLHCCYAMAETVFGVSQTTLKRPARRIRCRRTSLRMECRIEIAPNAQEGRELVECGAPIDGISVAVYDSQRKPLADGFVGEIGLSGDFLFSGYNEEPERTRAQLCDGTYFTRDLGFVLDGAVYVLGRLDDLIIVNGRNIYAHEIEDLLRDVDGLKPGRAVAVPWSDARVGSDALVIIAEKLRGTSRTDRELRSDTSTRVFSVINVMPKAIHLVEEGWLVKTTSGKISREANIAKLSTIASAS